ncbi:hypothetical protein EVC45_04445 [Paraburkholderia sp. UYCP14C]|uniref:hypothetical protein n=1 Tax=Paraburkholderia sp. UYCP14C TaxID=2511130 RepID=UPI001021E8EF|nr:hypothetical protein [Paraburkholderia sp. UYCP14C]RZF31203.1 hypothetical protein EVC45_04445 [Paraburkholderia sp. UYCP14C]
MDKPKHRHRRRELLSRYGRVTAWHASLFEHADRPRGQPAGREARASIQLEGEFTEPVGDTTRFLIQVSPTDKPDIGNTDVPNVGAFISIKPVLQGVVDMTECRFQQLLTLAASGRLAWCFVSFTMPYRRSALIVSPDGRANSPTCGHLKSPT